MSSNPSRGLAPTLVLSLALGSLLLADGPARIHVPGGEQPPALQAIGSLEGLTALAVSAQGDRAAKAVMLEPSSSRTQLTLYNAAGIETQPIELSGRVRDLLFSPDGATLYGVLHRSAKKSEGTTYLLRVEGTPLKAKRALRLPTSTQDLDHWPARNSLLVASRNSIRTLALPDLRSGPLFRVIGTNRSVAALAGGSLILVAQDDALLLVDLADPPGQEEMPFRERVELALPLDSLAAAADASHALARSADGRLLRVEFDPLRLREVGDALAVTAVGKDDRPAPVRVAPLRRPAPEPAPTAETQLPVPIAAAEPTAPPVEPPPDVVERQPAPPATERPRRAEAASPPATTPGVAVGRPTPPRTPDRRPPAGVIASPRRDVDEPQVSGRLVGPALDAVAWVVLLGPDSILREAERVRPERDGSWAANGLAPGRYRIQIDGGGRRALITTPAFRILDVVAGSAIQVPEFQVRGSLSE